MDITFIKTTIIRFFVDIIIDKSRMFLLRKLIGKKRVVANIVLSSTCKTINDGFDISINTKIINLPSSTTLKR